MREPITKRPAFIPRPQHSAAGDTYQTKQGDNTTQPQECATGHGCKTAFGVPIM